MTIDPKRKRLEDLCQEFNVDPASLPPEFLEKIGKNYFVSTESPDLENRDLKILTEHHGVDINKNPEYFRKVDRLVNQLEQTIKDQATQHRKLQKEKEFDKTTGCYVSGKLDGLLYQQIALAREKEHPLSVIMMDLDHFGQINKKYGWVQGTATLKTIGNIVKSIIQAPNMAIRAGGEEFYIILPETDAEEALKIAEKIHSTIGQTIFKKAEEKRVTDDGYKHVTGTLGVFTYHSGLDSVLGFYELNEMTPENKARFMIDKLVDIPDQPVSKAKLTDKRNQVYVAKLD